MTRSNRLTRSAALALLGLPGDASAHEITQAYRRLAKATHPDRTSASAAAAVADPAASDQQRFARLADAYHALASTPETSPPETSPSGRTPSPDPSTAGAVSVPVRVRKAPGEPPERPPIVAGPVHITPSPPPAAKPWRSP
jgi:DnaJ domain